MPVSARYLELKAAGSAELDRLVASRPGPDPDSLAGWEWRGCNTPWFASLLGIRKFIKGFFPGPAGVEGYNVPVSQNGVDNPWLHKPSPDSPHRFGFYLVRKPSGSDNKYPDSLLLDYGASPRNPSWKPERLLRDYLVQPDASNPDLLLGKAYLALGTRVAVSFFILERLRRTDWKP